MSEDVFMAADRDGHSASANPLYALSALLRCKAGEPLPEWLHAALAGMALATMRLQQEHWDEREQRGAGARAIAKLPAALGFTRNGWNAFDDQASRNEGAWTALDARYLEAAYESREAAIQHLADETGVSRSTIFGRIKKAKDSGQSRG